jgi:hypothetical protein
LLQHYSSIIQNTLISHNGFRISCHWSQNAWKS